MAFARVPALLPLLASLALAGHAAAACSVSAFATAREDLQATTTPLCGPRALQRAFERARRRASTVAVRMAKRCGQGKPVRVSRGRKALAKVRALLHSTRIASQVLPGCALAFEQVLDRLEAELVAAETGVPVTTTTTTTSPPGASTTTTEPVPCTAVILEVDVGDCTHVTSVPRGRVDCDENCDTADFTVPADQPLQLKGTPESGDTSVLFDGDCNEDGTVLLDTAVFPDCSLACDCSSESP